MKVFKYFPYYKYLKYLNIKIFEYLDIFNIILFLVLTQIVHKLDNHIDSIILSYVGGGFKNHQKTWWLLWLLQFQVNITGKWWLVANFFLVISKGVLEHLWGCEWICLITDDWWLVAGIYYPSYEPARPIPNHPR